MFNRYDNTTPYTGNKNTYNHHGYIKNSGRDVGSSWGGSAIDTSWTPWARKEADDRILSDPFYRH